MIVFKRGAELSEQCTKEARRRRITRQVARDGVDDPQLLHSYGGPEEGRALERIKDMQFTLGLVEFSDDEEKEVPKWDEVDNEEGDEEDYDEDENGDEEDEEDDGKGDVPKQDEPD